MQLANVLGERIVGLNAEAADKKKVLTLLAGRLRDTGHAADVEAFRKDIYLRESEGTTGTGNYIAIPHEKSDSVTQVSIAIAKLKHKVEWETLDDKGIRPAFLFVVSNDHEYARNYMLLLTDTVRKLGNDETVKRLLQVEDVEELKGIFAGK